MRITLAQVVVAITTQNKRSAYARRILTIPSIKLSNRWAWHRWRERKPFRTHPPHISDTRPALWDVRAGRKVTTDILDVFWTRDTCLRTKGAISSRPVMRLIVRLNGTGVFKMQSRSFVESSGFFTFPIARLIRSYDQRSTPDDMIIVTSP